MELNNVAQLLQVSTEELLRGCRKQYARRIKHAHILDTQEELHLGTNFTVHNVPCLSLHATRSSKCVVLIMHPQGNFFVYGVNTEDIKHAFTL